jgi:hypothetical protein
MFGALANVGVELARRRQRALAGQRQTHTNAPENGARTTWVTHADSDMTGSRLVLVGIRPLRIFSLRRAGDGELKTTA